MFKFWKNGPSNFKRIFGILFFVIVHGWNSLTKSGTNKQIPDNRLPGNRHGKRTNANTEAILNCEYNKVNSLIPNWNKTSMDYSCCPLFLMAWLTINLIKNRIIDFSIKHLDIWIYCIECFRSLKINLISIGSDMNFIAIGLHKKRQQK